MQPGYASEPGCDLPVNSTLAQLSAAALGESGAFARAIDDFNPRRGQCSFAENVARLIESGGVLVAESGTGTGKTFAYLVPALLSGRQTVISTGTRHLQDQLFFRDLPRVREVLGQTAEVALLKGRSNYLCLFRLAQLGQDLTLRYQQQTGEKRALLESWAQHTSLGEIAEVSELDEQDPIWRKVTSTAENCLGSECPDFRECYVNKARQRALKAQIVVVNHHLFFSDVTLKEEGFGELLPDYDVVIFDEAHLLPGVATRFFGFTLSTFQLEELCRDILVAEAREKSSVPLQDQVTSLRDAIPALHLAASRHGRGESELLTADAQSMAAINRVLDAMADLETDLSHAAAAGDALERAHQRILQQQGQMLDWLEHSARGGELVCWFDTTQANTRLVASPLSISGQMHEILQRPEKTAILTSATLAAGEDFSYYLQNLGLQEVDTAHYDSPFDYAGHALLYLPEGLPEPQHPAFADAVVEASLPVLEASQGRAFMLFTSYAMLHRVAEKMRGQERWTLFVQGQAPRGELIDRFRQSERAVLLGTASFWEGVDIRGEDLSCVIIDKLPFAPPNDPVMRARLKQNEQSGGKPFFDIQVPDAIITLKQGAGRLIRDESDRGVLVICDSRLHSKGYGKKFLDALPPMRRTRALVDVQQFFRGLKRGKA